MATVEVVIHPAQVKLLVQLQRSVDAAQERLNLVMAGVIAGHGYDAGHVAGLDAETNTLTIETPADG